MLVQKLMSTFQVFFYFLIIFPEIILNDILKAISLLFPLTTLRYYISRRKMAVKFLL